MSIFGCLHRANELKSNSLQSLCCSNRRKVRISTKKLSVLAHGSTKFNKNLVPFSNPYSSSSTFLDYSSAVVFTSFSCAIIPDLLSSLSCISHWFYFLQLVSIYLGKLLLIHYPTIPYQLGIDWSTQIIVGGLQISPMLLFNFFTNSPIYFH